MAKFLRTPCNRGQTLGQTFIYDIIASIGTKEGQVESRGLSAKHRQRSQILFPSSIFADENHFRMPTQRYPAGSEIRPDQSNPIAKKAV